MLGKQVDAQYSGYTSTGIEILKPIPAAPHRTQDEIVMDHRC